MSSGDTFPKNWPSVWADNGTNARAVNMAAIRRDDCEVIARAAREQGLSVTAAKVNMHYRRFRQWYEGRLATGYLIRLTGIREMPSCRKHRTQQNDSETTPGQNLSRQTGMAR